MKGFIQLVGPQGAFYVDRDHVASIGHEHIDEMICKSTKPVRLVTTVGGSMYHMWDDAANMSKLLK